MVGRVKRKDDNDYEWIKPCITTEAEGITHLGCDRKRAWRCDINKDMSHEEFRSVSEYGYTPALYMWRKKRNNGGSRLTQLHRENDD